MADDPMGLRTVLALVPRARALAVHLLTALGAVLGLLALMAAFEAIWTDMFFWLALAALIDGVDGWLARRYAIAETLPRWSGEVMDFVVDFLTYVFVPVVGMVVGGILPEKLALPVATLILVVSVIYFADRSMKTADGYFRGFPAAWNLVAFYLFLLRPEPYLAFGIVLVLCALTFVPVQFVHPLRVDRNRPLSATLLAIWVMLGIVALINDLSPPASVIYALVAVLIYFLGIGLLHQVRARSS
jgi:phosphatidylcholine synthase